MDDFVFEKASLYPPLVLAYMGDAVYELYVRSRIICEHGDMPPHKLHLEAIKHVKAEAQSNSMLKLEPILSETELKMYKRGRNTKSATVPKNADVAQYRRATGLETLFGYLYIEKQSERLNMLMKIAYEHSVGLSRA